MIKDSIRGDWNKADKLNQLKKENFNYFFYKIGYDKPYLPPRTVALYYSLVKKDIKDQNNNIQASDGKYFLLILQTLFYYLCLFFLSKTLLNRSEDKNIIFFSILFLSLEPTILQWHSSFFTESIFFSLQIIILALFLKKDKKNQDYILIGFFCGMLFLQKSAGIYYFFIVIFFLSITENLQRFKKITIVLLSYLLVCLFIGYTNYIRSNNFYLTPLQTKEAMFVYLLPKIYQEKDKISFEAANKKIINKTENWIKKNNVDAKINTRLFAEQFGSEDDRIKIHTFQQQLTFDEMKSNIFITSKILVNKYFHALLINPVEIHYFYKYNWSDNYFKSNDHKKWVPIRIFYTFLIYSICLYGFYNMFKEKKLDKYNIFWLVSGFYFYLVLGWMGYTRYFAPVLIYLPLFFASGVNKILFKRNNS